MRSFSSQPASIGRTCNRELDLPGLDSLLRWPICGQSAGVSSGSRIGNEMTYQAALLFYFFVALLGIRAKPFSRGDPCFAGWAERAELQVHPLDPV